MPLSAKRRRGISMAIRGGGTTKSKGKNASARRVSPKIARRLRCSSVTGPRGTCSLVTPRRRAVLGETAASIVFKQAVSPGHGPARFCPRPAKDGSLFPAGQLQAKSHPRCDPTNRKTKETGDTVKHPRPAVKFGSGRNGPTAPDSTVLSRCWTPRDYPDTPPQRSWPTRRGRASPARGRSGRSSRV